MIPPFNPEGHFRKANARHPRADITPESHGDSGTYCFFAALILAQRALAALLSTAALAAALSVNIFCFGGSEGFAGPLILAQRAC